MADWYCMYCDRIVPDNDVRGARHKECGWYVYSMKEPIQSELPKAWRAQPPVPESER